MGYLATLRTNMPHTEIYGAGGSVTARTEHVPAKRSAVVVPATTGTTSAAIIRFLLKRGNRFLLLRDDFLYFHAIAPLRYFQDGTNVSIKIWSPPGISPNSGHAAFIGSTYGLLPTIQNREFSFNNSGLCSWIHVITLPS